MKATIKRVTDVNVWVGDNKPTKLWAIVFEDGSWFDTYKTKKKAIEDAKEYGIAIK